ncbi:hypothetical protein [Shewanella sp.]|uniref:hypothetical protein n=1 Tax=Shewanella sp. TaxID=50422 RepID=UPI003D0F53CB
MNISSFIPSWFDSTSSSSSATTAAKVKDSVDLSTGLDSMFGQVIENALDKVSSGVTAASASTSNDSLSLLGVGLADGLLTSFYQSKISNSLTQVFNPMDAAGTPSTTTQAVPSDSTGGAAQASDSSGDGLLQPFTNGQQFSFGDILDVVNPLQHIPLINYYYRDLTGDEIGFVPQVVGSSIYGGALGAVSSLAEIGVSSLLGESPVKYALNTVTGNTDS